MLLNQNTSNLIQKTCLKSLPSIMIAITGTFLSTSFDCLVSILLRENHGSYECIYIICLKGPRSSSTRFKVEVYCKYKLSVLEIQREICRIYKTPTNCIAYVYCKGWGKLSRRCHFRWIYLLSSSLLTILN